MISFLRKGSENKKKKKKKATTRACRTGPEAKNQEWMKENSLTFIPKLHNPPSASQFRPIEAFWLILKQKVFSGNWSAKDRPQLICQIKICALEIDPDVITKMVQNLKAKIHEANKNELTSLL